MKMPLFQKQQSDGQEHKAQWQERYKVEKWQVLMHVQGLRTRVLLLSQFFLRLVIGMQECLPRRPFCVILEGNVFATGR